MPSILLAPPPAHRPRSRPRIGKSLSTTWPKASTVCGPRRSLSRCAVSECRNVAESPRWGSSELSNTLISHLRFPVSRSGRDAPPLDLAGSHDHSASQALARHGRQMGVLLAAAALAIPAAFGGPRPTLANTAAYLQQSCPSRSAMRCPAKTLASFSGQTIFVAPSGNDRIPGTKSRPIRTLLHARDLVRKLDHSMHHDLIVSLAQGTYTLSHPLSLGPRDSGTNGHSVVWMGAPGASAVVSGARKISGWHLSDPGKGIWAASVPVGLQTRQIYVNGMRALPAFGPAPVHLTKTKTGYEADSAVMVELAQP